MLAFLEFGNVVVCRAAGVASEVVAEVVVQIVCTRHFAIDDKLQVVSNAVTGGVDAVLVHYFGHEVRRTVHVAAVDKRGRIEIAVY